MNSMRKRQISFINPSIVLLAIGLIVGLILCVFIPYGAGFDEEQHALRIYDLSGLHLIPNRPVTQGNYAPSGLFSLAYSNQFFRNPGTYQFRNEYFFSKIDWQNMTWGNTNATYSPIIYLPQAFVAGLAWRVFNFPIILAIIAMRLAGFLLYLLLCYLAIRILPVGKWIFLVLALSPAALFQASTLSADGYTNAISFLFTSVVFQVLWGKNTPINLRDSAKLFVVSILLGAAKSGAIVLLPILLLLFLRKAESKKVIVIIIFGVLLSILVSIGWTLFFSNFFTNGFSNLPNKNTFAQQIILVLQNLNDFLPMYLKGIFISFTQIYQGIVGEYSYWGRSFSMIYILFPIAIFLAFASEKKNDQPKIKERIFLFLVSIFCVLLIGSVIYVTEYIPGHQSFGSQGRYLIPFIPLLFISWAALFDPTKWIKQCASILTILLVVVINGFYLVGFYRVFYSNCFNVFNAGDTCKLPIYQNLDVNNLIPITINQNSSISQSFQPKCSKISGIDIRVYPKYAGINDFVRLSVFNNNDQLVCTSNVPASSINTEQPIPFPFTSVNVNKNEIYHFSIGPANSQSSQMILVAMGIKEDFYKDGAASMNGKSLKDASDLVFQYTCVP
jgi:uncharacterized membrane protein